MNTSSTSRGTTLGAILLAPFPLLAPVQDWYVDVGYALCSGGIGTQARPFCSIMDAVNAAADGDTIHIAPGTYLENVVLEKDLALIGTGGQAVTILDGMASGTVVRVGAAEVTLTGLTLTNGSGSNGGYHFPNNYGGGIFAYDTGYSSSTLPQVTMTSCTVTGNTAGSGGGIFMATGSLTLADSTVSGNTAIGGTIPDPYYTYYIQAEGGGIKARGSGALTLTSSTVEGNHCLSPGYASALGGGIRATNLAMRDSSVSGNDCQSSDGPAFGGGIFATSATLTNTSVSGNVCDSAGAACSFFYCYRGGGGGIAGFELTLDSSSVSGNLVTNAVDAAQGGGLWILRELTSTGSTVAGNTADGQEASGGGIFARHAGLTLVNTTVTANAAAGALEAAGGGIYSRVYGSYYGGVTITSSSLSGNRADAPTSSGGGLLVLDESYYYEPVAVEVANSILWDNGPVPLVLPATLSPVVEYSLVEGGWSGTGNIDADPLFVDPSSGDLHLMPGSPCIDAGDSLSVPPGVFLDRDGKRRFLDDPLTADTGRPSRLWPVVDIGAHEFGIDRGPSLRQSREAGRPVARFAGAPTRGPVPVTVSFTDQSGFAPSSWLWDFGDGSTSTARNPVHVYSTPGNYTVSLTVANEFGPDTSTRVGFVEALAVVADFSGTPRSGSLPLVVSFTDLSEHAPTGWLWDFGDGGSSTEQHPTHAYTSPGTYAVSLTTTNAFGSDVEAKPGYVQTFGVAAGFSGTPRQGSAPLSVSFTDLSANGPTSWLWDFGDGGTSTEQHPVHVYTSLGTFTVTLTASNASSSDSETKPGYVQALGVIANFGGTPRSGTLPLSVSFTDLTANGPTTWLWDFGDGSTSSEQHPTHVYTSAGLFSVSLTASNSSSSDTETKSGYVQALGVVANFSGAPQSGVLPLTVRFLDLSVNGPTSWLWDFGDGTTSVLRQPTHTFSTHGKFTVSLTASNAFSSSTRVRADYIEVLPLVAEFKGAPLGGTVPLVVQFTDLSTNSPTSWLWSFGDGDTSTLQHPSHTYTTTGAFTVALTVSNALGSATEVKGAYILVH